nr:MULTISPECIES: sulfurtransferase TusA [unclassified Endozoicomonas]
MGRITGVNVSDTIEIDHELDTSGLLCPEPVMMLHNKVRDMKPGEMVRVIATDPSTQRDIPKFCNFLDHELLSHEQVEKRYIYLIRKSAS